MEALKYPIGKAEIPDPVTDEHIKRWIDTLEALPAELVSLTKDLSPEQLNTPYREGGWTVRQVVHHLADSHYNSYIRFKWTLTEDRPVIKAYYEDRWAELHDYQAPIEWSLDALKSLHAKWVYLLRGLSSEDLNRTFIHPEGNKEISLKQNMGIYAWHSRHHLAHIRNLLLRKGWLS